MDVPLSNACFTWFGPCAKKSRLDRALVSTDWSVNMDWALFSLHRRSSDHSPICLKAAISNWGPKAFKFYNAWLEDANLVQKLKQTWLSCHSTNIHVKFRKIREQTRKWCTTDFGSIDKRIKEAETQQSRKDQCSEQNTKSVPDSVIDLDSLYSIKSSLLCQKSRLNWQLKGERNTRFFHRAIAKRRFSNSIHRLRVGASYTTNPVIIKETIFNHFRDLLAPNIQDRIFSLNSGFLPRIDDRSRGDCVAEFTLHEIEKALEETDKTKSPGPDGLNAGVLTALWPTIQSEVLSFFNHFHATGTVPNGLNSSFIALIPKTKAPNSPSDYRPISLMNALMKLLTKVLARRLKRFMPSLLGQTQTTFIKGRHISDSILLANEVVHAIKTNKTSGVVFKIDFEKAFDRVQWGFVYEILEQMNFHHKWIKWIKGIFETTRISVLVNGAPTQEFSPNRGLRQGDPLSPLIFNLVGEVLSLLLNKAMSLGLFDGISLPGCKLKLSHLQFADDVLLFISGGDQSLLGIKRVLQCFQILSGMKINFNKSHLHGFRQNAAFISEWAELLGCQEGGSSFKYLGASIGSTTRRGSFWQPLIDRIRAKIKSLHSENISIAGKVIILKSIIDSLPVYWFGLYQLPKIVVSS